MERFESLSYLQRKELQASQPGVYAQIYQEYCAWLRPRALADFWVFLSEVLCNPVLYEPLHRPLAEWLGKAAWDKPKRLLLLPRGHVKSNILTVGFVLWQICKDTNIRVLLASHKHADATKFMGTIQTYILNDPHFAACFPEIKPALAGGDGGKKTRWNQNQMLVNRESRLTENTVECTSLTSKVTGRHYDLLVADDLVTDQNVATDEQIEKTREFHQLCESLLDPGALELVLGTRYHFDDEYGTILGTPDLQEIYECQVQRATKTPGVIHEYLGKKRVWKREDDFEHLIYPSRFTLDSRDYRSPDGDKTKNRKSLLVTYRMQGSTVYANQYDMEPFDPAKAVFKKEDIHFISRQEFDMIPRPDLSYFQACDLSSELHSRDSYTAIVTGAVGPRCDIYITNIFWQNCEPSQIRDHLISSQMVPQDIRPLWVGFEKGPYEKAFMPDFQRACAEKRVYMPIKFTTGAENQRTKETRIMGLQPLIEAGKFHIVRGCRNSERMVEELTRFPMMTAKDVIDAAAKIPSIAFPPDWDAFLVDEKKIMAELEPPPPVKKQGVTFDDVLAGLERRDHIIGNDRIMDTGGVIF